VLLLLETVGKSFPLSSQDTICLMKMLNNCRIHKEKYDSDREDDRGRGPSRQGTNESKESKKSATDGKKEKSRTRAFFSRKKSNSS
jgi:hypothetical protein